MLEVLTPVHWLKALQMSSPVRLRAFDESDGGVNRARVAVYKTHHIDEEGPGQPEGPTYQLAQAGIHEL